MHNGYLPTVHVPLGFDHSAFDSREYLDYVVDPDSDRLDEAEVLGKLDAMPPGGTSGNAIAVNRERAYVVCWTPADTRTPRYYAMQLLRTSDRLVIASEVVPALAPATRWEPLPRRCVLGFPVEDGHARYEEQGEPLWQTS